MFTYAGRRGISLAINATVSQDMHLEGSWVQMYPSNICQLSAIMVLALLIHIYVYTKLLYIYRYFENLEVYKYRFKHLVLIYYECLLMNMPERKATEDLPMVFTRLDRGLHYALPRFHESLNHLWAKHNCLFMDEEPTMDGLDN